MAKTVVTLSKKVFPSLKEAKNYYGELRKSTAIGTFIAEPDRSDIIEIYKQYCKATNYPFVDAVNVTAKNDNEQRPSGTYATTKAFAVIESNGQEHIFSIVKALSTVAN